MTNYKVTIENYETAQDTFRTYINMLLNSGSADEAEKFIEQVYKFDANNVSEFASACPELVAAIMYDLLEENVDITEDTFTLDYDMKYHFDINNAFIHDEMSAVEIFILVWYDTVFDM